MSGRKPVEDWLTDWDHLDPRWVNDPFPIWEDIRASKCPIAHTERFRGAYLPTRYEDVRNIAYDPEHFSSRQVVVRENQIATGGAGDSERSQRRRPFEQLGGDPELAERLHRSRQNAEPRADLLETLRALENQIGDADPLECGGERHAPDPPAHDEDPVGLHAELSPPRSGCESRRPGRGLPRQPRPCHRGEPHGLRRGGPPSLRSARSRSRCPHRRRR